MRVARRFSFRCAWLALVALPAVPFWKTLYCGVATVQALFLTPADMRQHKSCSHGRAPPRGAHVSLVVSTPPSRLVCNSYDSRNACLWKMRYATTCLLSHTMHLMRFCLWGGPGAKTRARCRRARRPSIRSHCRDVNAQLCHRIVGMFDASAASRASRWRGRVVHLAHQHIVHMIVLCLSTASTTVSEC